MMTAKRILVIAGSDSSGGAGLEADQKVIAAHGCYAMTATTALTAQNTLGVMGIHGIPPEFVKKQIDACIDDIGVDVIKTGMLTSASTISMVANAIKHHSVRTVVVDPVMVATSGAQLLPEEAVKTLIADMFPVTTLLTPNIPEANLLLKEAKVEYKEPENIDDLVTIAESVRKLGPEYVLLKGGHLPLANNRIITKNQSDKAFVVNVLVGDGIQVCFESDYLNSRNTHGTGCSLASAIACNLASNMTMSQAVKLGSRYVEAGIKTSRDLGKGSGPINHFHSTYKLPFSPGFFVEYLLQRDDVKAPWKAYIEHDFVKQLAAGTLPLERFKNYLIQDYIFLIHFARANALAAYKSSSLEDISKAASLVANIQDEVKLHLKFCEEFGVSLQDVTIAEESQACTAYTRFVLDVGHSEDFLGLHIALLPCIYGYGEIARRLYQDPSSVRTGNKYWLWVEQYASDDYRKAMKIALELVEKHAILQSECRIDQLARVFIHATKMEAGFWDLGLTGV